MSNLIRIGVLLYIVGGVIQNGYCQVDSVEVSEEETIQSDNDRRVITIETYADRFDPQKALIYSALLPGAGQAYNQSYWKLPIVYGGFAVGIYAVSFYQNIYSQHREELFSHLGDSGITLSPSGYSEDQLRRIVSISQRQRDFWIILNGFWYLLQIVEAHVDAHLKEFDLNPNLQVQVTPFLESQSWAGRSGGLAISVKF